MKFRGSSMGYSSLSLDEAREAILNGSLVVFPTETFFAIGCDAMNADAVGAVFSLKNRALSMPLPVVIGGRDQLSGVAAYVSDAASALMDAFWPGSLSVVLPANPEVPELLTANAGRIAVRFSPHPAVLRLCEATGKVLVASSANLSGSAAPRLIDELPPEILGGIAGVYLYGPPPEGGLPSTVADVLERRGSALVRVLRAGAVSVEAMRAAGFTVQPPPGVAA